ncbi:MAG TPA: ATP-binding cassette domain-containing protein [Mycobacteriales bacterium]|nr:ATP-binding cassette domain-containing protein [Mycobacteriales bacterium]
MDDAIVVESLVKTFKATKALDGIDLTVPPGTVLGLLGPNGAGKTTCVRILATLLRPDAGRAWVTGLDVLREPQRVRARIGLTGQYAAVDDYLTGQENLEMVGRLYHLRPAEARGRAVALLDRFELSDASGRVVKTYSGGMRRRLDIAAALIARPRVLFLDEPTTGLDPRSRIGMWELIEGLVRDGTTILLTTQYLDEADRLASTIAVIDIGKVIASGTARELKSQVGGERLEVTVAGASELDAAVSALAPFAAGEPVVDVPTLHVTVPVSKGAGILPEVVRDLDAAGVTLEDLALRHPTLDDVFLALTGHAAEEKPADGAAPAEKGRRGRRKEPK